ncbi:hypothetical protein MUK42_30675 [Musa troglodytarum]|uniref:Uncharacterized protein n=1 Tax=Musa troglodytarum TaxID=320322 RepID=A0A9E7KA84_9LILI|nr:hypothetical protein MUK42_30675 [Musa troglodytarum]
MAACSSGTAKWKLREGKRKRARGRKRPNQRYSFAAVSNLQKQAHSQGKLEGAKTGTARTLTLHKSNPVADDADADADAENK